MNKSLIENFFKVNSVSDMVNGSFDCKVTLNAHHPIYKGHFPQIPVAPGVCLTQMIKEIIEVKTEQNYNLTEADNIKFLALINPVEQSEFEIQFQLIEKENKTLQVVSNINANGKIFVKFKGLLTPGK